MNSDNLDVLKDDMIAFIEGHGLRHFPAVIPEDTPRVWWNDAGQSMAKQHTTHQQELTESWKDFVETAKAVGSPLVCIGEDTLDKTTLELLTSEIETISNAEDDLDDRSVPAMEKLQRLSSKIGKLGHIELAFPHQGILFMHETSTEWYRDYREVVNKVDLLQESIENVLGEIDGDTE